LLRDIAQSPVGETVTLTVRRDGQERGIPVVVQEWPRTQRDARDAPVQVKKPKIIIPPDLGLSLSALDPQQREQLGVENGLDGVVVTNVAADTDPAQRGIKNGDLILRVMDNQVATPDDVQSEIDAARAAKRAFILMLVLPKVREVPGPKWMALQLETGDG
jgi:serine protease Do